MPQSEPLPPPASRHVFVYGTLRRGDVRDITRLHPAPVFVGWAWVPGVLYDLGPYPGLRLGGAGRVVGEVYAISAELERVLDEIEEVWPQASGEYAKREIAVQLDRLEEGPGTPAPETLSCLVYEINPARVAACPVIAGGDWRRRSVAP